MIHLLIEMALIMLVMLGIYQFLLTNTTLHKFKRVYLLMCLVLPLFLPFIEWKVEAPQEFIPSEEIVTNLVETFESVPEINTEDKTSVPFIYDSAVTHETYIQKSESKADLRPWFISLYLLVLLLLLIRYGLSIYNTLIKVRNAHQEEFHGTKVVILNSETPPHNFLNYIFININDYRQAAVRDKILLHELSHARERHSVDILLVELLRIIFWFNPLYIFLSRAIRNNHEYLADSAVIQQSQDLNGYQKVLLGFTRQTLPEPQLASFSNYNLIKKRFTMMKHKTPRAVAFLRIALLIPLFLGSTAFFVLDTKESEASQPISLSEFSQPLPSFPNPSIPDILPVNTDQYASGYLFGSHGIPADEIKAEAQYDSQVGIDFIGIPGTPVRATASGTVIEVKQNDRRFGNFIRVKHDDSYETLYAKLGSIDVNLNQTLTKGEEIGSLGEKEDIFGRVHYKIIVNGKAAGFGTYREMSIEPGSIKTKFYLPALGKKKLVDKYDLEPNAFDKKLPDNMALESMVFDRNKMVIIMHSGETITKKASELNEDQKRAILSITRNPYRLISQKEIPAQIVEKWDNYDYYKIWIDGKRVENSEMSKYSPADFGHHSVYSVLKHARNPSAFELRLHTNEYHAQQKQQNRAEIKEWNQKTRKILKDSGLI